MKTILELFGVLIFALCITYVICAFISGELDIRQIHVVLKGTTLTIVLFFSIIVYADYKG